MKNNLGLIIFVVVFVTFTFGRLPYDVNMPGGLIDLSDRVEVNGKDVKCKGYTVEVTEDNIMNIVDGMEDILDET